MSGRFSPLTAPLPFRDLPFRAPLVFFRLPLCSAHLTFWPAPLCFPLHSNAPLLCSHACVNMSRARALPVQMLFYLVLLY